jgi:hypothetical protein
VGDKKAVWNPFQMSFNYFLGKDKKNKIDYYHIADFDDFLHMFLRLNINFVNVFLF